MYIEKKPNKSNIKFINHKTQSRMTHTPDVLFADTLPSGLYTGHIPVEGPCTVTGARLTADWVRSLQVIESSLTLRTLATRHMQLAGALASHLATVHVILQIQEIIKVGKSVVIFVN